MIEVTLGSDEVGLVATAGLVPSATIDPEKSAERPTVNGVRYSFPGVSPAEARHHYAARSRVSVYQHRRREGLHGRGGGGGDT